MRFEAICFFPTERNRLFLTPTFCSERHRGAVFVQRFEAGAWAAFQRLLVAAGTGAPAEENLLFQSACFYPNQVVIYQLILVRDASRSEPQQMQR